MLTRGGILGNRSQRSGKAPTKAPYAPVISWPHVRDSVLLLVVEVGIDLSFRYAERVLPVSPNLLREPRRVLHWFIVATVCWFCADPLLRLVNNTRKGLRGSNEPLISMGIQQGDQDEEKSKSDP